MKAYKIEMMTITANTKKEAVEKYIEQYFDRCMCKCEKSFNTLYKNTIEMLYTYDVVFNNSELSDSMGFHATIGYCRDYIKANNGTKNGYFANYKGGIVSIMRNETSEDIFTEDIK